MDGTRSRYFKLVKTYYYILFHGMSNPERKLTTIHIPPPLLKQATKKAEKVHGARGLSRYVRQLITADLASAK